VLSAGHFLLDDDLLLSSTNEARFVVCFDSLTESRRHVQVNEFCEFLGWSNDHSRI